MQDRQDVHRIKLETVVDAFTVSNEIYYFAHRNQRQNACAADHNCENKNKKTLLGCVLKTRNLAMWTHYSLVKTQSLFQMKKYSLDATTFDLHSSMEKLKAYQHSLVVLKCKYNSTSKTKEPIKRKTVQSPIVMIIISLDSPDKDSQQKQRPPEENEVGYSNSF